MTQKSTIGITGAAGYIGSRVTADLVEDGYRVIPIDDFSSGNVSRVHDVKILEIDISNRPTLREIFTNVDTIIHLAAVSGVPDCEENPERSFDVNVRGTENIAWICYEWGIPLIFASSMAVLGDPSENPITSAHNRAPLNHYGLTKKMSEDDIYDLAGEAFPAHVYMKSNVYGQHEVNGKSIGKDTVINIFVERARDQKSLKVFKPGTQARDFVHVKDVARAYEYSLDVLLDGADTGARTLPIASGEQYSVKELAELVQKIAREELGYNIKIDLVDNPRESETIVQNFTVDTTKARENIGFETEYTVEETVRRLIRKRE